jgi:hypothetical protein
MQMQMHDLLQNTEENRKYRRKQDEYTVRKWTRAVKLIARRYIIWAVPTQ